MSLHTRAGKGDRYLLCKAPGGPFGQKVPAPFSSKTNNRSGAILAFVLASLLVASLLGLAVVKTVLQHHRQVQVMSARQQCFWLAEAAAERAARKLAGSSDYQGETWEVSSEVLGTARPAVVTIEVNPVDGSPQARKLRAEARFADDPARRTAFRRELVVWLPQAGAAPRGDEEKRQNADAAIPESSDPQQQ